MPLGDVSGVIHDLVTFHPEMDVCYTYRFNGRAFTMDTRQFREVLGGVRLDTPEVSDYIAAYLRENQQETDGRRCDLRDFRRVCNMKSLEELKAIRERMQGEIGVRKADANETRVVVGMATCGIASGARPVLNRLAELVREKGLNDVIVTQAGCIGLCQYEPIVEVFAPGKEKVTYIKMTPEKAEEVVEQHLMRGLILAKYTLQNVNL